MGSREFYDDYVERQLRVGVNERHRSILRYLLRFGLQPHHRVLEIGCGVGTLTGLLADELRDGGRLLGVDLSPRSIEAALEPGGFVLAHYPNPHYLAWCHDNRPDLLQELDQPVWADRLTADAYGAGLTLEYLETYSIWIREGDYQVALLRPRPARPDFHTIPERRGVGRRIRERLRGLLDRLRP